MQLGGNARFFAVVQNLSEVRDLCLRAKAKQLPIFVLGGGSNTVVHDEGFNGVILKNELTGFEVKNQGEFDTTIRVGAGEIWDNFVKRTVDMGLTGIEALSVIPGCVGGAPVQNVGAYGQEVSETIISVETYDTITDTLATFTNEECKFGYRESIFRSSELGRYVILAVTFKLYKTPPQPPFYKAVQDYLDERSITAYTPQQIRDAVIAIRTDKLPDPTIQPNAGSFFKNAIVDDWQLTELKKNYPDIPNYDMGDGSFKIPTGWLIEQTGVKGTVLHGIRVHDKNALVLINESAGTYANLAAARQEIITAVRAKFNISIEQEPLELK